MSGDQAATTLQRPYLLRAMHEWMTDNALTPHIVIDIETAGNAVPVEFAKDSKLIVNVSYSATNNLHIGNDAVIFDARFSGVSRHVQVPIEAVLGIYARESGQGMIFSNEEVGEDSAGLELTNTDQSGSNSLDQPVDQDKHSESHSSRAPGKAKKPTLTVVK